ncbi:MAG: LCP family protein [bacterium]|nr:LCP family protein [bacterium]
MEQKKIHTSLFRRITRYIPKNKSEYQQKKIPFFFLILITLIAAYTIFRVTDTAYQYVTHFDIKDIIGFFSTELKRDEKDHTNILILGNGGGDHDGADLTDTIIVASLDNEKKSLSMLSIPRDLWVDIPGYGSSRINKIFENLKAEYNEEEALDILKETIENITNVSIPYYAKIDFAGFEEIIDTLGGIDIEVEKSIYDTAYPTPEGGYEIFELDAGLQHLDGETALKYARSRHSTSDFDRAARQHKIMSAIKQKVQESNLISSPLKVKKLFENFSDHLATNMLISEMISLASFFKSLDQDKIVSAVIKDNDLLDEGTFLYTPEREQYGGAFVLIPIGKSYDAIQRFTSLVFDFSNFFLEKASIQILNGTKRFGLARTASDELIPYGLNIQHLDNADRKDYENTHYYIHHPENTRSTEEAIRYLFPQITKITTSAPEGMNTEYDVSIVLGDNFNTDKL